MSLAVITGAIILLIALAFVYRRFGAWRAGARLAIDGRGHVYGILGQASESADGRGRSDSVFSGDMDSTTGAAFLGVVVDGMGEDKAAERARSLVLHAFLQALRGNADDAGWPGPAGTRLNSALEAAHRAVREAAAEEGLDELGASVAAVMIHREGMHWVSTGNSRICLYRDGLVHQVTLDHTFGALLARGVMQGQLAAAEAAAKQERDALTSYVGAADPLDLDSSRRPLPLRDGDRVILCTHGLHAWLTPHDMADAVRSAGDDASAILVERALAAAPGSATTVAAVDFLFAPAAGAERPVRRPPGSSGSRTTVRVVRTSAETEEVRAL